MYIVPTNVKQRFAEWFEQAYLTWQAERGRRASLTERLADLETQESDLVSRLTLMDATAEQPVPEIPPETVEALATRFLEIYKKSDDDIRRFLVRALIQKVEVERDNNILRGIIYFYYPPELPPITGGSGAVPISQGTPGAPQYRHIIPLPFTGVIKYKSRSV